MVYSYDNSSTPIGDNNYKNEQLCLSCSASLAEQRLRFSPSTKLDNITIQVMDCLRDPWMSGPAAAFPVRLAACGGDEGSPGPCLSSPEARGKEQKAGHLFLSISSSSMKETK